MSEHASKILKIQNDLSCRLGRTSSLTEALQLCVEAGMEAAGMELGGIYLVNREGGIDMLCHKGLPEEFVRAVSHFDKDAPRMKILMQGNPIFFSANNNPLPESVNASGAEYYKALAVIPFKHNGEVIGCMNIGTAASEEISGIAAQALETIGNQIGDILARVRAQEQLRESEEKFSAICRSAQNAVIMMDARGRVSFWNNAAETMFGYSETEAAGRDLHDLIASGEQRQAFRRAFSSFRETGRGSFTGKTVELAAVRKNGEEFPAELTLTQIRLKGEWNASGIVRDISQRKREEAEKQNLQQQLQQAQKMEAIGTLAGGIAHDFNNIIAAINGTAEMMLKSKHPESPDFVRLERIIKSGLRARDLSMKLLTFARKEKLQARTVALDAVIADLTDMLRGTISRGIAIRTRATEPGLHIHADTNQILQALLNICLNACEAMPEGGAVVIETGRAAVGSGEALEACARPGAYCVVSIKDSGHGMDETALRKIFDPFFTTKEPGKGTGLGLSVTHGIVHEHNGFISVQSAPGQGTAFRVFLPEAAPCEEPDADPQRAAARGFGKGAILVIDDDTDFNGMIAEALESEGYDVIATHSGPQALEAFKTNMEIIDAVILDMILPDMDGTAIFRALKELRPDATVILCSGHSQKGKAAALLEQGAAAYIQKPFLLSEIFEAVQRVVHPSGTDE